MSGSTSMRSLRLWTVNLFDLLQFESSVNQNCLLVLVLVLSIFLGIINHVGRRLAKLQRFSLGLHSIYGSIHNWDYKPDVAC
jgi:hypothetical protein